MVTMPAARLAILQQPPKTITANTGFGMSDEKIPVCLLRNSAALNMTFHNVMTIEPSYPKLWEDEKIIDTMKLLKKLETRIILSLLNSTYQTAVLSEAYRNGLSSRDGYQWIFLGEYAHQFPINEQCGKNVRCSEAFKGSLLFTENYNTSNFNSKNWYRALDHFLSADRTNLLGLDASYPESDIGASIGLGYDAVWLFAEALSRIISRQQTATGVRISKELRRIQIRGLTGVVRLSTMGERRGFWGSIKTVCPEPENKVERIRFVQYDNQGIQTEYNFGTTPKYFDHQFNLSLLKVPLPFADIYNIRQFISYSGAISFKNFRLTNDPTEAWPSNQIIRYEKIVPPFTCRNSCGKRVSINDVNIYDRGICVSMDTCECFNGYYEDDCSSLTCSCLYGFCNVPFKCICSDGWQGRVCDKPICSNPCIHGRCVEPEECKCNSWLWIGANCNQHVASIIAPLVLLGGALIYLAYKSIAWLKKYIERRAALSDLSWVVDWEEVSKVDSASGSKVSCMVEGLVTWNREKWFVKYFNSKTIDINDRKVRYDMVELVKINHKNLIEYGGACLNYPNVCLLLEPAHKGSLEDILVNESIELGWDFRFSFMKDICNGMNFIYAKTEMNSHGRLKSSNCLLDNRWTIRLSGFGASSIRYGSYSMSKADTENPDVYDENQTSLLWTAPELLQSVSCLDDVRSGTPEGDAYSFGIIVSEIATRDVPFGHERTFLSLYSILDLIVDKDNPSLESEREVWCSIGGDMLLIRPQVTSEQLPETKAVKKKFRKMMADLWCEEPQLRLTFQKIVPLLDKIHPTKGELMDTLIGLLESYSSNLEQVVGERTAELEVEKIKIDNIISQMLPKQVVESLKRGEKVPPEIFDNVTCFYSDIVGFTTIAKKSQPMQVVDLLNTLYGKFDGCLAQYDVYKVETIGDCYVVSSGVPERNGNLHAGEIATATIDIVCTIMTVPIPHLPDDKLLLRIGIHSGSVVGGVVGLKMPRYTLFGETMQITSNMEATSKPLHIQVSHYTIEILKELGGYKYKRRGETEVCGRTIHTYWLVAKDGYDKKLPEIED